MKKIAIALVAVCLLASFANAAGGLLLDELHKSGDLGAELRKRTDSKVDDRPYWERNVVTPEEGCHYGTGTDCSAFCTSPKTHWSIEIQGCVPDPA